MAYTVLMKQQVMEGAFAGILLAIGFGIVLHAPVTVWLSVAYPEYDLFIKAWKELLMGIATILLLVLVWRKGRFGEFLRDRVIQLVLAYAAVHLVLIAFFRNDVDATAAGLLIDLRYILYFTLVYGAAKLLPRFRTLFLSTIFGGAAVVLLFALLQMFVLPRDVLLSVGYGDDTIAPYLTVDDNDAYVRINSTLRGPNPLGAYVVILLSLMIAAAVKFAGRLKNDQHWAMGIAVAVAALTLGVSYSRSALLGFLVVVGVIAVVAVKPQLRKRLLLIAGVGVVAIGGVLLLAQVNTTVSHFVLHDDPNGGARIDSNRGHAESLIDGTALMIRQPLGGGIGSTGSASILTDKPLIIENQYLFIAHEVGWVGLVLFLWLFIEVLRRLWQRRHGALSLGVFASGCGLAIIGLLLPVWVDDTVSIIWWGLAGVAIGGTYHHARTNNKKTARITTIHR